MRALARAKAAVTAGELAAALAALLEAWRDLPAPAIAAAIDAVGARAAAGLLPPTGKTVAAREAAWADAARSGDPVIRHVLVASLTDTKGSDTALARIEVLAALPPDPRVSAKIANLVEVPAYNASVSRTSAFWNGVFALLPQLGDPRIAERARSWPATWKANAELNEPERPALAKRLAGVADALAAMRVPELAAAGAATCAEIVALASAPAAPAAPTSEPALLAAIYDAPADDAPRLVYADWLQRGGDPRGEYIALQLTRASPKREKELWAELGTRWLAAYPGVKKTGARFERGFLAICDRPQLDDDPIWSTVRAATIHAPAFATLAALRRPLHVAALTVTGLDWDRGEHRWTTPEWIAAFARITVLPGLRRLVLRGGDSWLTSNPHGTPHRVAGRTGPAPADLAWAWTRPLDELVVPGDPFLLGDWIAAAPAARLTISTRAGDDLDDGWRFRVTRGGAATRLDVVSPPFPKAHWFREHYSDEIAEAIEWLPAGAIAAARVAIHPTAWDETSALRGALASAFAARGIDAAIERGAT